MTCLEAGAGKMVFKFKEQVKENMVISVISLRVSEAWDRAKLSTPKTAKNGSNMIVIL